MKKYQRLAFDNILRYNKSMILWPRQMGKSLLLSYYIENFITNNSGQNIIFFDDDKKRNKYSKDTMIHNLNHLLVRKKYNSRYEMSFVNDNNLTFCSIQESYEHNLFRIKPSVIIYDDFYHKDLNKYYYLFSYISKNKCKVIFTSTYIDTRVISALDYNNDFYINIRRITENVEPNFINYDYEHLVKNILSYKSAQLLDFDGIISVRRQKLEYLKKI